jgi:hypothetical protein
VYFLCELFGLAMWFFANNISIETWACSILIEEADDCCGKATWILANEVLV